MNSDQQILRGAVELCTIKVRLRNTPCNGMQASQPSKNHLARNMQGLQVFFLQDLHDLVLNLARILQVLH